MVQWLRWFGMNSWSMCCCDFQQRFLISHLLWGQIYSKSPFLAAFYWFDSSPCCSGIGRNILTPAALRGETMMTVKNLIWSYTLMRLQERILHSCFCTCFIFSVWTLDWHRASHLTLNKLLVHYVRNGHLSNSYPKQSGGSSMSEGSLLTTANCSCH